MSIGEVSRPPGLHAAGMVKIAAGFGAASRVASELDGSARKLRLANEMFQIPFAGLIAISSSAGTLPMPDAGGPNTGYYFSVRRMSAEGFSAGTVTVYKNGVTQASGGAVVGNPEIVAVFNPPTAGLIAAQFFGRGDLLLNPNDFLTFAASGITVTAAYAGVQINGSADCFPSWLLPEYLM